MLNDLMLRAVGKISDRLGLDPHQVDFQAQKLQATHLLRVTEPRSLQLARLLVSAMASSRPVDAVDAVEAYESIVFDELMFLRPIFGVAPGVEAPHERIIVRADEPTDQNTLLAQIKARFAGNLVEAVARHIELARPPVSIEQPDFLSLSRDLAAPRGEFYVSFESSGNGRLHFKYGTPADMSGGIPYSRGAGRLQIMATSTTMILHELAGLLGERHWRVGTYPSVMLAGVKTHDGRAPHL